VGEYVLRICCSALICGALGAISGSGTGVRKVVCGLFLAFVVISPLREIKLNGLIELPEDLYIDGEKLSETAVRKANDQIVSVIKEEVASYILVEAASLGVDIQVASIDLDQDTLEPVSITLSGDISPYKRQLLADYIFEKLGIGKEQQLWNGKN